VCESPDTGPTPAPEPPDVAAETEMSLDEKFSVLEAALEHCADNPPFPAAAPQETYHPLAESPDVPVSR
jgi:hypothetical protein